MVKLQGDSLPLKQDQLKDGIGRMICRSYSLGRKIISSASTTILCTPVCCAQQFL
jgi:hypothetical protein